ncbi:putative poly(beta-D-mannuronate) O-acetylase (Alginate biosynthesis protein algI) [Plesiocystis pacifica SIR-1]|uniref:Putative poly(Beta-D-mannuronate) O-acetylase (Alginate biosynthesis protein algI) n=1 Tax=Plesiocystis pacifica SIR-1 TaxID=391625 RepID=A6G673_9BACT|nr:MBOAT family O-acyltransferase [Plesiocystis pacifica]EDM78675.1 putative poly(beta-D-mannuronate) O-acetylase (Alginate biosynthesis protein algI) [Plesiocystis pacifica SIR-1]
MLFASFDFLLFIVPVLLAYWALRDRPAARVVLLLGASYFFYMAGAKPPAGRLSPPWTFAGLLVFSTVLDYVASMRIHARAKALRDPSQLDLPASERPDDPALASARRARNTWLTLSLAGNLGLLAYFKYVDFLLEATVDILQLLLPGEFGEAVAPQLAPLLPIGISFYTFQSLSYTIDVWRRRLTPEPRFGRFALFVVFFPQLVAGPIVRASEFLPQLHRRPKITATQVEAALFRIFKGLLKKVVLGDFIAVYFTDIVFATPGDFTSLECLLALYAFTLQIYADFAGYSDIAIGVAKLLGFSIPENFDRPYQAQNVGEFWRRWHMTLSTWLRDYLFFPLGGSRGSNARTYFNLWLTMFLVGMWHGASWNFVIYSNLQGGAMLFNRWNRLRERSPGASMMLWGVALPLFALAMYGFGMGVLDLPLDRAGVFAGICAGAFALIVALPLARRDDDEARKRRLRWLVPVHVFLTFHFSTLTRVFFRAEDLDTAKLMIAKLLAFEPRGVRAGLFRVQGLHDWLGAQAEALPQLTPLWAPGVWLAEYGLLLLLVFGTAYHFTPREWVDVHIKKWFTRLPGPALGLIYAALALLLLHLLDGPRANIYFDF